MATTVPQILPRAPIASNPKTDTLDFSDNYKRSVLSFRDAARDEALSTLRMNPEWEAVRDYIDMLEGRQWDPRRPRYRSRFFDNRVAQSRIDALSLLTDIRPAIEIDSEVGEYLDQAKIAQDLIYYEWGRQDLDLALVAAVDHALFSVGYWKLGAAMPGTLTVTPCGMDSVLPIQPGFKFQDAAGILYRTYKPVRYFKDVFGHYADGVERETVAGRWTQFNEDYKRPDHMNEYTFNALSPAMRYMQARRLTRQLSTETGNYFPVVELEEYWIDDPGINEGSTAIEIKDPRLSTSQHNYHYRVEPGHRTFPRKRLIVMGGNKILYDGPSPYWHGLYPFAQLILNPMVWAPGGISKYRNLMPLQRAVNNIGAGTLDVVRRALEPQIAVRGGSVYDSTFDRFHVDMPGGRLMMSPGGNPQTDLRYLDAPSLPAYVQHFAQYLEQAIDRSRGAVDVMGLGRKNQVPGGDTIEQMRDSMQTSFRLESRYIEPFLRSSGIQAVSNIFQFYTRERRVRILGPRGQVMTDFDYDPGSMIPWTMPHEDHWKLFGVRTAQGSLHGAARDRDKQVAISLFRLSGISRRQMLRTLEFPNIDEIEREIKEEREGQMQPEATGKGQVPRLTRGQRTGNPY